MGDNLQSSYMNCYELIDDRIQGEGNTEIGEDVDVTF